MGKFPMNDSHFFDELQISLYPLTPYMLIHNFLALEDILISLLFANHNLCLLKTTDINESADLF